MNRFYDLPLFRKSEGEALRDAGIETISSHNESWLDACKSEARIFIRFREQFTGEDIRLHCQTICGAPKHHNAWGALINALVRERLIRATGEHRKMRDKTSHAIKAPVYERSF